MSTIGIATPNFKVGSRIMWLIVATWISVALFGWQVGKPTVFPSPLEVLMAMPTLWADGLGTELISSWMVNLEALALCCIIGLPLIYTCRIPVISPVVTAIGKLRFVGPSIFFLPLLFILSGGHAVKVALLTLGMLFYLITTMAGVVQNIPEYKFDDARTLRMSEWLSVWYVVIRGTVVEAIDAIRDNAAMGWSMLMFVEGIVRSEGGVGVMILNQEKHIEWAAVWGIALSILMVGVAQDWVIGQVKKVMCPYAT